MIRDCSHGVAEVFLTLEDGREVVRLWDRVLELDVARVVVDALGHAVDVLDGIELGMNDELDLTTADVELVIDLTPPGAIRLWGRALDLDDARDTLDALGEALDAADEHELANQPHGDNIP